MVVLRPGSITRELARVSWERHDRGDVTMSKEPKFTRRRALAGLGTIGTGAVIGGAGTMAWLNDQESVNSNSMTAGTLDLMVDAEAHANRGVAGDITIGDGSSFESDIDLAISLGDLKPGDSGYFELCLKVTSNPAWVWLSADLTLNDDGTQTEPELEVDTTAQGDLAAAIDAKLVCDDDGTVITSGSLHEVINYLADGGVRLEYYDSDNDETKDYFPADNERCVRIEWEIPTATGNVIQGDKVKFDLMVAAEQYRHNSNPTSPFA